MQIVYGVAIYLLLTTNTVAQSLPSPINNAQLDKIQSNYDKKYIQERQEQEEQERLRRLNLIERRRSKKGIKRKVKTLEKRKECFKFKTISLEDATVISKAEQAKILKDFYGSCITANNIDLLVKTVTNWYIEKGFVTSRVYIPKQNIKTGKFRLKVIEGRLERIKQNQDTWVDSLETYMAFPMSSGDLLNIRDVKQGLDKLNSLASNNATSKMLAGLHDGYTILQITNQKQKPFRTYLGVDNTILEKVKVNSRLEYDNLFYLDDALQLRCSSYVVHDKTENINYGASFSIPFGYWFLSLSSNLSHSLTYITLSDVPYEYRNLTNNEAITLSYILFKGRTASFTLNTSLAYQDRETFFAGELLEVSSRSNANLSFGFDFSNKYSRGFYSIGFSAKYGLTGLFNVTEPINGDDVPIGYPKTRFSKYNVNGSICYYFSFWGLKYCSNGTLQLSKYTLFAEEQISVGGRYSVRGFNQGGIIGDSGFYIKNDLSIPILQGDSWWNKLLMPSLFIGLDFGFADKKGGSLLNGDYDRAWLAGFAFGVKSSAEYGTFSLTAAVPIAQPKSIYYIEGDNFEIYADLTVRLW